MNDNRLQTALVRLCNAWEARGLFSRHRLITVGTQMAQWRRDKNIPGLWPRPPVLATATLDDGIGMGLDLIELYAGVAGMRVERWGLLMEPKDLVEKCKTGCPDLLGLTVLREDAMDLLDEGIAPHMAGVTTILAGGPVFRMLPLSEQKEKPYVILPDLSAFVRYVLSFCHDSSC